MKENYPRITENSYQCLFTVTELLTQLSPDWV